MLAHHLREACDSDSLARRNVVRPSSVHYYYITLDDWQSRVGQNTRLACREQAIFFSRNGRLRSFNVRKIDISN